MCFFFFFITNLESFFKLIKNHKVKKLLNNILEYFNGPTTSIFFSPPFGHLYLCKSPRTKNTLSNCNYPISKTNIDLLIPASPIYNFGMSQIFLWLKTFQINLISTLLCFRSYKCLI